MFPSHVSLQTPEKIQISQEFWVYWKTLIAGDCHTHPVWETDFVKSLKTGDPGECFELAATWATNMVVGSYCFPRYVAALAARAEQDAVRYGLLENAWDEAGGHGHTTRSHFWLAVKLARLLGLKDDEIAKIKPLADAQAYTDEHFSQCATGEFGFALGMICLIEEFTTPEFTLIFKSFLRSCREGMGVEPDTFVLGGGAEYFTANIADDEKHREDMPRIVAVWMEENGVDLSNHQVVIQGLKPVLDGVKYSAALRQKFFDGIYAFVKNGGTYRDLVS